MVMGLETKFIPTNKLEPTSPKADAISTKLWKPLVHYEYLHLETPSQESVLISIQILTYS